MTTVTLPAEDRGGLFSLHWGNWRLALIIAVAAFVIAIPLLPPDVSFWVCAAATVLVAANSTVTNTSTGSDGQVRYYRLRLELVREDDRWLTSDVQFVR